MKFDGLVFTSCLFFSFTFLVQCELITWGTLGLFGGGGYYAYEKYVKCRYSECCNRDYILEDVDKLDRLLSENLFGQHIAHKAIVSALRAHINIPNPPKALALSFHGMPGTGKNYVAEMIAKSFFKESTKSKYYYFYNARHDFPLESKLSEYKEKLIVDITNALKDCDRSLFIFDEVDKTPEGLLNVLIPFLDYHTNKLYNHAVFIFLSNTGSYKIMNQTLSLWKEGNSRNKLQLTNFESLIAHGAFNEKGGFHLSETISKSIIDVYVPFLPLEEVHVKLCVKKTFQRLKVTPTEDMIKEVMAFVTFGPKPYDLYSTAGCKRIEQKAAAIVYSRHFPSAE